MMKLTIIQGNRITKAYPLHKREPVTIGRHTGDTSWMPDIDLYLDKSVSRKHASLEPEGDVFFVRDLGSKNGTRVADTRIRGPENRMKVPAGIPVVVGTTILMIDPAGRDRAAWDNVTLAFDFSPVINYSLFHCGIPPLSNVRVDNLGTVPSKPFCLTFSIPEYSHSLKVNIPSIDSGQFFRVEDLSFKLLHEKLEELPERVRARLEVTCDAKLIFEKQIWVLGFYEWSYELEFKKTLASFVQPGHPLVQKILVDAEVELKRLSSEMSLWQLMEHPDRGSVNSILHAIYNCLRNQYELKYVEPPPGYELRSQVIRPPHKILVDIDNRKGSGTCLDLTLLMASCLEALKLNPLIIILKENQWQQHALAGCWTTRDYRFDTILSYRQIEDRLSQEQIYLVECTGFSRMKGEKLTYEQSLEQGRKITTPEGFLYGLDIRALRNAPAAKITPINYKSCPEVLRILRKGEWLAKQQKSKQINSFHLLYGFMSGGGGTVRLVFDRTAVNIDEAKRSIAERVRGSFDGSPTYSRNYRRALKDSKELAALNGLDADEEYHLLSSFLDLESKALKEILEPFDISARSLRKVFNQVLAEKGIKIKKLDDTMMMRF